MPAIARNGYIYGNSPTATSGATEAVDVSYDNSTSALSSTNVQSAIDELSQQSGGSATGVTYDNTVSGLAATNVQSAIDETYSEISEKQNALTPGKYINIDANDEISVQRVIPNESFTYEIKFVQQDVYSVSKIVDSAVVLTINYSYDEVQVPVIFDNAIKLWNENRWNWYYELLINSDTHPAGYKQKWGYSDTGVDYVENFSTVDHSGEKLIIQSELNSAISAITDGQTINSFADVETALTGKQNTLTFDSVPTDGSTNPVESNGIYDVLTSKQNATDDSLQTTSKTVVGAINEVNSAISNLPEPMVFKGSLGTGGTIETLPVDGSATVGDTYKVITEGTYAGQSAKVGDTFICDSKTSDANTWVLIPSGDETSGTVTSVGLSNATNGGLTISGSPITSSGTITVGHSNVITAGTAGGDSTKTLAFGSTFSVPSINYDINGHITSTSDAIMTMPADPNTDTTYQLANGTGDDSNKLVLTPSTGDAQKVIVAFASTAGDAQTVKGNEVPVQFSGSSTAWNAMSADERKGYDIAIFTDDYNAIETIASDNVTYSNVASGLSSTTVQGAIDELSEDDNSFIGTTSEWDQLTTAEKIEYDMAVFTNDYDPPANPSAANVSYSNTSSGLAATNVQSAIDEISQGGGGVSYTEITYAQWQNLTPQEQAAKDYFISDYPGSSQELNLSIVDGKLCVTYTTT